MYVVAQLIGICVIVIIIAIEISIGILVLRGKVNKYFSEGKYEEIITLLITVKQVKRISLYGRKTPLYISVLCCLLNDTDNFKKYFSEIDLKSRGMKLTKYYCQILTSFIEGEKETIDNRIEEYESIYETCRQNAERKRQRQRLYELKSYSEGKSDINLNCQGLEQWEIALTALILKKHEEA